MAIFYTTQNEKEIERYQSYLQTVGALSSLFSDSPVPYLYYRVAERIFCRSFNALDLSRSDVSADAKKNDLGIGLKHIVLHLDCCHADGIFTANRARQVDFKAETHAKKPTVAAVTAVTDEEQALESGDKTTGCTVHYVTEELDSGTIIDQSVVPICSNDDIETLTHRVQQAEHRLLPLVINNLEESYAIKH